MFIPELKRIIEVKSNYTLGLTSFNRRSNINWKTNQLKAEAVLSAGFNYTMMVMTEKGDRILLPKLWFRMSKKEVLLYLALRNGNVIPNSLKSCKVKLSDKASVNLQHCLQEERNNVRKR